MTVCKSEQKCLLPIKALLLCKDLISFIVHGSNPALCSKQTILEPNGPQLQGGSWAFQHDALQHFWVLVPSLQQERSWSCISSASLKVHPAPSWLVSREGPPDDPEPWYPGSPLSLHINLGATYQRFSPWIPFHSLFTTGFYVLWLPLP